MDKTTATYQIPAANFNKFMQKIERVNRRAAKLGAEPVVVAVVREYLKKIEINPILDVKVAYREITVSGTAPKVNGWTFVATLQHLGEEGNLIRTIPGVDLPESFRSTEPKCEHCNLARRRIDTYILQSESGEFKQVGSNCLCDFLGGLDPHKAASWCETLCGCKPNDSDFEGGFGGSGQYLYDLQTYLSHVAMTVEKDGWLSRSKARDGFGSTASADIAFSTMCPDPKSNEKRQYPTDAQKDLAQKALTWIRETYLTTENLNDYKYNMVTVTRHDDIDERMMGLAASLIQMYSRAIEREIQQRMRAASEANSQFFGTEKKREVFELILTRITPCDSQFGPIYMHRFLDKAGNVAVWFSSNERTVPRKEEEIEQDIYGERLGKMEVGQTYQIKGTVKKHEEYKGVKQTMLTRCKVESKVVTQETK